MKVTFNFTWKPRPGRPPGYGAPVLLAGLVAAAIAGCSAAAVERPVAGDATWANERWPGTTIADLSHGRDVFVSRCASCHSLPRPDLKSSEEWANVLEEMAARAKLSSADRDLVLRYLSAASQRLRSPTRGQG